MSINWQELFENAFESAKRNTLESYRSDILPITFDLNTGLHDLCMNADFAGLFASEIIKKLDENNITIINRLEISKVINNSYMKNSIIFIEELEKYIII